MEIILIFPLLEAEAWSFVAMQTITLVQPHNMIISSQDWRELYYCWIYCTLIIFMRISIKRRPNFFLLCSFIDYFLRVGGEALVQNNLLNNNYLSDWVRNLLVLTWDVCRNIICSQQLRSVSFYYLFYFLISVISTWWLLQGFHITPFQVKDVQEIKHF